MNPADKSPGPIPGPAGPGHFPHAGIPSLPSPRQQQALQGCGWFHILLKKSARFKSKPSPKGNSCSLGRQSSSGPCQSGMGNAERNRNVSCASFVDVPSLFPCIPCAWHGHGPHLAGERGWVGNGWAIKHGSTAGKLQFPFYWSSLDISDTLSLFGKWNSRACCWKML